jgi:hypothetical protein
VISIDTKKKEPIGPYKNAGSDYRPEGCPDKVNVHDFVDKELGKVVPGACPWAVMSVFKGCGRRNPPRLVIPVASSDAGMRGGGRALSDG